MRLSTARLVSIHSLELEEAPISWLEAVMAAATALSRLFLATFGPLLRSPHRDLERTIRHLF